MKNVIIFFSAISIPVLLLAGCSKKDDPVGAIDNSQGQSQNVIVWAQFEESFNDRQSGALFLIPNIQVSGVVLANELPLFEYWKAANKSYVKSQYYPGYIAFGTYMDNQPIRSRDSLANVEVKTSFGVLSGSTSKPGLARNITSSRDTIQRGQSLTISWIAENADFYEVSATYYWRDGQYDMQFEHMDTILTTNSVTFSGSRFSKDGKIRIWGITTLKGPFPKAGAIGNMGGTGTGFLYSDRYQSSSRIVVVGSGGSFKQSETDALAKHTASIDKKLHEMIIKTLRIEQRANTIIKN